MNVTSFFKLNYLYSLYYLLLCYLLSATYFCSTLWANEIKKDAIALEEDWHQYIHGFRKDHSFSWAIIGQSTKAHVLLNHLELTDLNLAHMNYHSNDLVIKGSYAFHIPIWQNLGYFLGSSFGISVHNFDSSPSMSLRQKVSFPGLRAGIVYNFSPKYRYSLGLDWHMDRMQNLRMKAQEKIYRLYLNVNAIETTFNMDIFTKLDFGYRVFVSYEDTYYFRVSHAKDTMLYSHFSSFAFSFGIGMIYHPL